MNLIEEFEKLFAAKIGLNGEAIAVNSGSSALLAVLKSLDLGPGDEVITTPFTFIATANAILHAGGTPVFADIDPINLCLADVSKKLTTRTKAILPVHLFGKTCNFNKSLGNVIIIEDCAQALGVPFVGTVGDAGCFSFYKTKNMSTFEGGMITIPSHSKLDAGKIRSIINHGRFIHPETGEMEYKYIGYNFRMAEPLALLGIHALEKHWIGITSEIGKYGPLDGYYPEVIYNTPAYRKLGIKGDCPNAEAIAREVKNRYTRNG